MINLLFYLKSMAGGVFAFLQKKQLQEVCRYRYWRKKVIINPRARINGERGIELGEGTIIYESAHLCAGYLLPNESIQSEPIGSIMIGRNCTVMPGAIIATYGGRIEIGSDVSINPNVIIYGNGGVRIGDKTRIATQVVIVAQNHIFADSTRPIMEQGLSTKGIVIGNDVWIGAGAKILDGITIGDGAVIGAGAVVRTDISPYSIAVGVPAKEVSKR
jgi:acetyltransferase-like isoleucine patch superfamily enzyme